jgi:glutamine cyclotransferase
MATLGVAVAAVVAGTVLLSACGSCDSIVQQTALPVLATGNFDGVERDQAGHRIFFADQANHGIDVVDISGRPRFMGTVDLPDLPNGLAYASDRHRLYAGLNGGTVAVIDADPNSLQFLHMIDQVTVDVAHADLLDYSPQTHILYASTADSNFVIAVDVNTDKVTNRYDLNVPVEQPRFDEADGKLYVTTPGTDSLVQIDPVTGIVTRTFTVLKCNPKGLAINPTRQLAVAACGGSTAVFNLRTGANEVSQTIPGGDLVSYDPQMDSFLVGSAHGPKDSSVGVLDGDGQFVAQVQSSPHARAAVFDDSTGMVYAVSAVGLLSFSPSSCAPPPDWIPLAGGVLTYTLPLAAFGLFLFIYTRRRAKARVRPSWEQLRADDLAAERQRIRDLEDAIYGPETG